MFLTKYREKSFQNGEVYAIKTKDNYPVEVTDTFLPYYTRKRVLTHNTNILLDKDLTNRSERWMIGVSCMSGCTHVWENLF